MSEQLSSHNPESEETAPSEQVVLLLKPGSGQYEQRLVEFLQDYGLNVRDEKTFTFDEQTLTDFYPHAEQVVLERAGEERKEKIMRRFNNYFTGAETTAILAEGPNALAIASRLKQHLRGILKLQRPQDGLHSSDNSEAADREKQVLGLGQPIIASENKSE